MLIYLSITPDALARAAGIHNRFAHVAYQVGADSRLLRQNLLLNTRGGLLSLGDGDCPPIASPDRLCQEIRRECAARNYSGVAADFEGPVTADRAAFLSMLQTVLKPDGRVVYIPEAYAAMVSEAIVIVCTALSGGQFRQRVEEAVNRFGRVALDVERLAMDFTVPAPDGMGTPLGAAGLRSLLQEREPAVFFSDELCARYITYTQNGVGHFVVFDDAETLRQKLRVGRELGCAAAFLVFPEVEDLLEELFSQGTGAAR